MQVLGRDGQQMHIRQSMASILIPLYRINMCSLDSRGEAKLIKVLINTIQKYKIQKCLFSVI